MEEETRFHPIVRGERSAETTAAAVLAGVVSGYVSMEAAARDYGVAVTYLGTPDQLVRLTEHYPVDEAETARLRARRAVMGPSEHGCPGTSSRETGRPL